VPNDSPFSCVGCRYRGHRRVSSRDRVRRGRYWAEPGRPALEQRLAAATAIGERDADIQRLTVVRPDLERVVWLAVQRIANVLEQPVIGGDADLVVIAAAYREHVADSSRE